MYVYFMGMIADAGDPEKKYAIQLLYQPIERRRNRWNAKFAVTQDLNVLIKVS